MKWAYSVKYKLKAAMVLTIIIVMVLASNLLERRSYSDLDESMTSIYNDRLKPATYLFNISSSLYKKRLLHNDETQAPAQRAGLIAQHNNNITALIEDYEKTYLTEEEQQQWGIFKTDLQAYNAMENQWLQQGNATDIPASIQQQFNAAITTLDNLNKIQLGEGNNLQRSSHSIISNNLTLSYLEISLLIVLGLATLVLLSVSDNTIFKQQQKQVWN